MKNQCERVLAYIKKHGSITTLEAMRDIGVARLGARICELRAEGVRIRGVTEYGKNQYGKYHYTRYYLEE